MLRRIAVLAAVAAALPARAEDPAVDVVVECSDGSALAGSLPASTEFVIAGADGEKRIAIRDVRAMSVSAVREDEAKALEAEVRKAREKLAAEDPVVRDAGSAALEKLGGAAAPFLAELAKDKDVEVATRARNVLDALRMRGGLQDPRDLVVAGDKPVRGWLRLEEIELTTSLGAVKLRRAEIRRLTRAGVDAPEPGASDPDSWPPPLALRIPAPNLLVTVTLRGGTRLVGVVPASALALTDEKGAAVPADRFVSALRAAGSTFRVTLRGAAPFVASFSAAEIALEGGVRSWKVAVASIESVVAGAPRLGSEGGSFAALVREWIRAHDAHEPLPTQRFWASIRNQPANPWNSDGRKLAMTWSLIAVQDQVALVGTDAHSDPYKGDTSTEMELPILAVKKRGLPAPEGVNAKDFYNGWSGAEIRMTKPVAGLALKSAEAANAIIREEFGDGWEMAEFHHPAGGWHWWGYWSEPPEDGK